MHVISFISSVRGAWVGSTWRENLLHTAFHWVTLAVITLVSDGAQAIEHDTKADLRRPG
jgi:hypothetical protein